MSSGETLAALHQLVERLTHIRDAHRKHSGASGMTSGDCVECGVSYPCPTRIWADLNYHPSTAYEPWDPSEWENPVDSYSYIEPEDRPRTS